MIVDGIGDSCCVDDRVSVQNECVVFFEAVVAVEAVQFYHCFGDGAIRMSCFCMFLVVVEIVWDLDDIRITLAICSTSSFLLASSGLSTWSGRMESARLTLLRLFSELDLWTLRAGGYSILLSLGIDSV